MIKYDTIGMIEHSEKNFPYVKAHEDMPFWSIVTVDFINNVSAYPTATEKKKGEIYLVDNTRLGDFFYETKIQKDEKLNCKSLKAFDQHFLVIDEQHITYKGSEDYNSIVPGTTLLAAGEDGKFEIIASKTGYAYALEVTQKCRLTENAVRARIVYAND